MLLKSITSLTEDEIAYIDSKSFNIPINDKDLKLILMNFSNVNLVQNLLIASNVNNQPLLFQTNADFILSENEDEDTEFQEEEEALFGDFELNKEEEDSNWYNYDVEKDFEDEEEYLKEREYLEKHSKKM